MSELTRTKAAGTPAGDQPIRCWDGHHGCERFVTKEELSRHGRICLNCVNIISGRYGVSSADFSILDSILKHIETMSQIALNRGASKEAVTAVEASCMRLAPKMVAAIKDHRNWIDAAAQMKAFRGWFFAQLGIDMKENQTRKEVVR
jgi:hypothetical protein